MRPTTIISTGTLLSLLVVLTCGAEWPHGQQPITDMEQTVHVFLHGPVALRVLAMERAVAVANAAVQRCRSTHLLWATRHWPQRWPSKPTSWTGPVRS